MRDENGRSRGFGFVSFQTPNQAALALRSMNGVVIGSKQIVVRLHEPKQLRQEKLAARFAGHNNHPRSRSGATSPTASEGGDSQGAWPSPRVGYQSLASPSGHSERLAPDRARRSSGSYYNVRTSLDLIRFDANTRLLPGYPFRAAAIINVLRRAERNVSRRQEGGPHG